MSQSLDLNRIPAIPQTEPLLDIAPRLWARDGVLAMWLGGSLARGGWDAYSDVDLFVAVRPDDMDSWREPGLRKIFGVLYVASQFSYFGEKFYVHHVFLDTGDIYDLHIQGVDPDALDKIRSEDRLVLGSRHEALAEALAAQPEARDLPPLPVDAETVQRAVESYWYHAHKHRKVLHRQLDLVLATSLSLFRFWYLRLVHIDIIGSDPGDLNRRTIYSLSPVMHALREQGVHEALLAVVGMPMRTRAEIVAAVDALNDETGEVGRRLAARYDFAYPSALEELVRRSWREFQQEDALTIDAFYGLWRLTPTESRYEQGAPPKAATYTIDPIGNEIEFRAAWTAQNGSEHEMAFRGIPDGQEHPYPDPKLADTLTTTLDQPATLRTAIGKDGHSIAVADRKLSFDGNTLTIIQSSVGADGGRVENLSVYHREPAEST